MRMVSLFLVSALMSPIAYGGPTKKMVPKAGAKPDRSQEEYYAIDKVSFRQWTDEDIASRGGQTRSWHFIDGRSVTGSDGRVVAVPSSDEREDGADDPAADHSAGSGDRLNDRSWDDEFSNSSYDPWDPTRGGYHTDSFDRFLLVGNLIWNLIEESRPAHHVSTRRVSVLPSSQPEWTELEDWQGPAMKAYTITAKNKLGSEVISYTYRVVFHHSGTLDGKGRFLANVTVIPEDVRVAWGFTLTSKVEAGDVVNYGKKSNPLPGLMMQVEYKIQSKFASSSGRESFVIKGDGSSMKLNESPPPTAKR